MSLEIGSEKNMAPTKRQMRKTTMAIKGEKARQERKNEQSDGQTINDDLATNAIASITANIAATSISINKIDNEPIIDEDRLEENNSSLVRNTIASLMVITINLETCITYGIPSTKRKESQTRKYFPRSG